MKSQLLLSGLALSLAAALCSGSTAPAANSADKSASKVTGDYVEVRTASVFAGACHYNGELVTVGREAIAAWNFTSGAWHGVDLTGVRAMAAVTSDANLGEERAARKVELVIDSAATAEQAAAVTSLLEEKCGAHLGTVVSTRRAPVTFEHNGQAYVARSAGYANLSVNPMPDAGCCKQPNLVWYSPLSPIAQRKVGFTKTAAYTAGTLGDRWEREGENSAFYGSFAY
jgi:hypothetical protein